MTDTSLQSNTALENETTHFGFSTVAKDEKVTKVAEVFHSVATKYDIMNDLMSGGIHRLWKRFTIDCSGARPGQRILDLGGGTGDLTAKFSRIVGDEAMSSLPISITQCLTLVAINCVTTVLWVTCITFKPTQKTAVPR